MAQWLTLWRAAQLVGVSRTVLQKMIRAGELYSNEGMVSTEELLRLYPQARLEDSGDFERVTRIKEEAFGKRLRERVLPSQEVLAQRLFAQSQELADLRRHLQRYHALVVELQAYVKTLFEQSGHAELRELDDFIELGLSEALSTESADMLAIMDDVLKVMSAQVTVRPSGHEFIVEGHDSLLQAGLKAGLKLNYGCGNGTCGLCKARITSGSVVRIQSHDYSLSEAEKRQGYTLLCAYTAGSNELTVETLEAHGPQDIPEQQISAKVRSLTALAPDTRLLHLQTPRTNRLRFLAGQNVLLAASVNGQDARAAYPVASCPCDDRNLHFYIARASDDPFAQQIFSDMLKMGDVVTVWGPLGNFVFAESSRPVIFAACDTGFAPVKSLIEHAMAVDIAESLSLYWLATRPDAHFLANQCRAWADVFDQFRYVLHADNDLGSGSRHLAQALQADLPVTQCDIYLAGPEEFVKIVGSSLNEAGVPNTQLFTSVV
jgi:CDP-4-dehydro-6-deoxyglucose reductase